jgi:SAM-dependent methyltransferase
MERHVGRAVESSRARRWFEVTPSADRPLSARSGPFEHSARAPALGVFSCVVDQHPRFHLEALRWFASLTTIAGVAPSDLVVNAVGSPASDALDYLRTRGVTVRSVEGFDPRSPHCNKVAGALRLAEDDLDGLVVLCDTDVAVLEDPRTLVIPPGSIGGKVVDAPVPPLGVLEEIFAAAGVPAPPTTPLPWGENESTLAGNCNGGLYLIPAPLLPVLAPAWETWARWLLDRRALLRDWTFHLDQVAMVLALAAEGVPTEQLDVRWNTPIHDPSRMPPDPPVPAVIHYHQEIDPDGRIRATGFPSIDRQIERVNDSVGQLWREAFPTVAFWQWRHLTELERRSRDGNQEVPLDATRQLVMAVLDAVEPATVLAVGGDGAVLLAEPIAEFIGSDVSVEAIRRGETARAGVRADLVVCLDVVIHEPDAAAYKTQVVRSWESADRALLISGYERPPGTEGPTHHFHEPLSATLRAVAPEAECYPVGEEGEIATFVVLRPLPTPHPRDVRVATLSSVIDRHPDPLRLLDLRLVGQRTLNFFPDHAPRLWEYPVAAELVMEHLPADSRLVDVGAGVTPLTPFLTSRGYVVDTVDPSEMYRKWPPADDWNEWGFLDYAEAGLGHRSWNTTLGELPESTVFDGAFSISVIEHIPATGRRALLKDIALRLRPEGLMVLTVDLARGSLDLWNRNWGKIVDERRRHGTFGDVINEGTSAGFELIRKDVVRDWGDVEVDIGLVVMRRNGSPPPSRRRAFRGLRRLDRSAVPDAAPAT